MVRGLDRGGREWLAEPLACLGMRLILWPAEKDAIFGLGTNRGLGEPEGETCWAVVWGWGCLWPSQASRYLLLATRSRQMYQMLYRGVFLMSGLAGHQGGSSPICHYEFTLLQAAAAVIKQEAFRTQRAGEKQISRLSTSAQAFHTYPPSSSLPGIGGMS